MVAVVCPPLNNSHCCFSLQTSCGRAGSAHAGASGHHVKRGRNRPQIVEPAHQCPRLECCWPSSRGEHAPPPHSTHPPSTKPHIHPTPTHPLQLHALKRKETPGTRKQVLSRSRLNNRCQSYLHSAPSNTLQHTATHYNTLRHTATHCNTLQHTETH